MAAVATTIKQPKDELQQPCETTTKRTGQQCPHYGYFDPVAGQYRCQWHETRGVRDEAA